MNILEQLTKLTNTIDTQLIITFAAVVVMNTLGTLKTIFLVNKKYAYLHTVVFADSLLYVFSMGKVINGDGIQWAILYATGRLLGTMLANHIENRIALGVNEYELYITDLDKARIIRDAIGDLGHAVNITSMEGYKGLMRHKLQIVIAKNRSEEMTIILNEHGITEPTLVTTKLDTVIGRIQI